MKREQEIFPYIAHLLNGAEVEWKPLGEVAEVSAGNSAPQDSNLFINGIYPFCRTSDVGKIHHSVNFYQIQDKLNEEGIKGLRLCKKETILLPKSGASTLLNHRVMLAIDSYVSSHLATIYRKENVVLAKYLFYFLSKFDIAELVSDKSYPSLKVSEIAKIPIPVPPLSVQQEIVRILDKFTQLEAELEAELDCRKRQYEYYRDKLLTSDEKQVEWKTLGEVGTFVRGKGLQKKDLIASGVPAIHYGQIYTYYGVYAYKTKSFVSEDFAQKARKAQCGDLVIATTSENDEDVCKAVAWLGDEKVVVSSDACFYTHTMNPKYVAYYFQTEHFQKQKKAFITGTKVKRVNADDLAKITIPVPPIEEQERITGILDKFDTLVNSISEGLPREIELRRKQYEYYREKLLSFPKN